VDNYVEPPARYPLLFMMLDAKSESGSEPRWHWRDALTNLFIAFFLYISIVQIVPNGACRRFLLRPVTPPLEALGLWQNFVTFGPEPPKINESLYALVTFDDGTSCIWHYPDLEHFDSPLSWVRSFRYRIFWLHYLRSENRLYSDFASYVGSRFSVGDKHPTSLRLVRRIVYIQWLDPATGKLEDRGGPHEDILYECSFAEPVKK
jgi:hypothetical protein